MLLSSESVLRMCLCGREGKFVVLSIAGCVGILLDCFEISNRIGVTSVRGVATTETWVVMCKHNLSRMGHNFLDIDI